MRFPILCESMWFYEVHENMKNHLFVVILKKID